MATGSLQNSMTQRYTREMQIKLPLSTLLATICLALASEAAIAQWQWMDKDGRKVFSDRSPPAEIAEKDILKRPVGATRAANAATITTTSVVDGKPALAASAAALKASAPKLTGKDAELEAKKKKAEEEVVAKKKAEEEKNAKTKADNCERAKSGLATLQSGVRIAAVNAKGEREVFDDAKRDAETKRTQEIIDSSCR